MILSNPRLRTIGGGAHIFIAILEAIIWVIVFLILNILSGRFCLPRIQIASSFLSKYVRKSSGKSFIDTLRCILWGLFAENLVSQIINQIKSKTVYVVYLPKVARWHVNKKIEESLEVSTELELLNKLNLM